jgi:hypothetical protein
VTAASSASSSGVLRFRGNACAAATPRLCPAVWQAEQHSAAPRNKVWVIGHPPVLLSSQYKHVTPRTHAPHNRNEQLRVLRWWCLCGSCHTSTSFACCRDSGASSFEKQTAGWALFNCTVWAAERRSAAAPPTTGPADRPAAAISLRRLLPASSSPGGCPSLPAASSRSSPALNRSVAFCRCHELVSIS